MRCRSPLQCAAHALHTLLAHVLPAGILEVLLRPSLTREGLVTAMRMMKDDVRNYAIAARDRGGSLRGRLEERGGYMKDGR